MKGVSDAAKVTNQQTLMNYSRLSRLIWGNHLNPWKQKRKAGEREMEEKGKQSRGLNQEKVWALHCWLCRWRETWISNMGSVWKLSATASCQQPTKEKGHLSPTTARCTALNSDNRMSLEADLSLESPEKKASWCQPCKDPKKTAPSNPQDFWTQVLWGNNLA